MGIVSKIEKLPGNFKTFLIYILDALAVLLGFFIAMKFENMDFSLADHPTRNSIYPIMLMYVLAFNFVGVYKGIIKYTSAKDYIMIGGTSLVIAMVFCTAKQYVIPRTLEANVIILSSVFAAIISISARVTFRMMLYSLAGIGSNKQRLLVIGAGQSTSQIIKTLQTTLASEYHIVGIIDDDSEKQGRTIFRC